MAYAALPRADGLEAAVTPWRSGAARLEVLHDRRVGAEQLQRDRLVRAEHLACSDAVESSGAHGAAGAGDGDGD